MKKTLAFIAIGSWAVVSLAFAAGLVLGQFRPEEELKRMLKAMSEVETVRVSIALSESDKELNTQTTVYMKGQYRFEDPDIIDYGTRIRTVHYERGFQDISFEARRLGDQYYSRNERSSGEILANDEPWILMTIPELEELQKRTGASEQVVKFDYSIKRFLPQADVLVVDHADLTELIKGKQTKIFQMHIDGEALRTFLRGVKRADLKRDLNNQELLDIEEQASVLEDFRLMAWIGTRDHLLYRLQATKKDFDFHIDLEDFNAPFEIFEPPASVPIAEFGSGLALPEAEAGLIREDAAQEDEERVAQLPREISNFYVDDDADGDGLPDSLELFYGTSTSLADTDGDGMNDGDEVRNGRNPRGEGSLFGFGLDTR